MGSAAALGVAKRSGSDDHDKQSGGDGESEHDHAARHAFTCVGDASQLACRASGNKHRNNGQDDAPDGQGYTPTRGACKYGKTQRAENGPNRKEGDLRLSFLLVSD
jgi:hypothetical protein